MSYHQEMTSSESVPQEWMLCDAKQFRDLFRAALWSLEQNYQHVNQLNVFPIPDGDTGTNMLTTMRRAFAAIQTQDVVHIGQTAQQLAQGAIMQARGNSGVILSQILAGLAAGLAGHKNADVATYALGMQMAAEKAYRSVTEPQEGTILSVMSAIASEAKTAVSQTHNLRPFFAQLLQRSQEALALTPEQLPILKESGVVDSGGQGLVYLLQGMVAWLNGRLTNLDSNLPQNETNAMAHPSTIPKSRTLEHPYDVQFLLLGHDLSVNTIRQQIEQMGNSTIVVGDTDLIKVHVHVKNPGEPLSFAAGLGQVTDVVVENMQLQMEAIVEASPKLSATVADLKSEQIGVVAVAAGEGLAQIFLDQGAAAVIFGGQTNNPSVEDILAAIERIPVKNIIVLPNNKNIQLAAQTAAQLSPKSVTVVPTESAPQGLNALLALNVAGQLDHTAAAMGQAAKEVWSGEITRAVRATRIDSVHVAKGSYIGFLDHEFLAADNEITAVVEALAARLNKNGAELIILYYGKQVSANKAARIQQYIQTAYPDFEVKSLYGGQPHYDFILGAE